MNIYALILLFFTIIITFFTKSTDYILGGGSRKIPIYGSVFRDRGKIGDFEWMIKEPKYKNSLFIFNDNVIDHNSPVIGAGNAVIRPYNKYGYKALNLSKPLSAGVPTGGSHGNGGGFIDLDTMVILPNGLSTTVKNVIDSSINEIKKLLRQYKYDAIYYSASSPVDSAIGTSIFSPGEDVSRYITKKIHSLGKFNKILL